MEQFRLGSIRNQNRKAANFCGNITVATEAVLQIQNLIAKLENNGSYYSFLDKYSARLNFIKSANNTQLIGWDCTKFLEDLRNARQSDIQRINEQMRFETSAMKQIREVIGATENKRQFLNSFFWMQQNQ